jgi:putative ABC transport system substrate-binding protein
VRRREFITLLVVAAGWALAAGAQQPAMPVIGFLNSGSPENFTHLVAAFQAGLKETGYTENQNVSIEYRWAESHYDRLPSLAVGLVRHQVAVIVATGGEMSAVAAKAKRQSCSRPAVIRSEKAWSPVSIGQAAI